MRDLNNAPQRYITLSYSNVIVRCDMAIARLKKLGGSVALTIPAPVAREVNFEIDMNVNINVENGALVISHVKKRRTLAEFLAQCDLSVPASAELAIFESGLRSGDELL